MGQRLVIWTLARLELATPEKPVVIDLDTYQLSKKHPELARALNGGRIISHSTVTWGLHSPTITFIVEDD